jgi:hypothetical protein
LKELLKSISSKLRLTGHKMPAQPPQTASLMQIAEDVVRRARAGDQNAMGLIAETRESSLHPEGERARAMMRAILEYCRKNPVDDSVVPFPESDGFGAETESALGKLKTVITANRRVPTLALDKSCIRAILICLEDVDANSDPEAAKVASLILANGPPLIAPRLDYMKSLISDPEAQAAFHHTVVGSIGSVHPEIRRTHAPAIGVGKVVGRARVMQLVRNDPRAIGLWSKRANAEIGVDSNSFGDDEEPESAFEEEPSEYNDGYDDSGSSDGGGFDDGNNFVEGYQSPQQSGGGGDAAPRQADPGGGGGGGAGAPPPDPNLDALKAKEDADRKALLDQRREERKAAREARHQARREARETEKAAAAQAAADAAAHAALPVPIAPPPDVVPPPFIPPVPTPPPTAVLSAPILAPIAPPPPPPTAAVIEATKFVAPAIAPVPEPVIVPSKTIAFAPAISPAPIQVSDPTPQSVTTTPTPSKVAAFAPIFAPAPPPAPVAKPPVNIAPAILSPVSAPIVRPFVAPLPPPPAPRPAAPIAPKPIARPVISASRSTLIRR